MAAKLFILTLATLYCKVQAHFHGGPRSTFPGSLPKSMFPGSLPEPLSEQGALNVPIIPGNTEETIIPSRSLVPENFRPFGPIEGATLSSSRPSFPANIRPGFFGPRKQANKPSGSLLSENNRPINSAHGPSFTQNVRPGSFEPTGRPMLPSGQLLPEKASHFELVKGAIPQLTPTFIENVRPNGAIERPILPSSGLMFPEKVKPGSFGTERLLSYMPSGPSFHENNRLHGPREGPILPTFGRMFPENVRPGSLETERRLPSLPSGPLFPENVRPHGPKEGPILPSYRRMFPEYVRQGSLEPIERPIVQTETIFPQMFRPIEGPILPSPGTSFPENIRPGSIGPIGRPNLPSGPIIPEKARPNGPVELPALTSPRPLFLEQIRPRPFGPIEGSTLPSPAPGIAETIRPIAMKTLKRSFPGALQTENMSRGPSFAGPIIKPMGSLPVAQTNEPVVNQIPIQVTQTIEPVKVASLPTQCTDLTSALQSSTTPTVLTSIVNPSSDAPTQIFSTTIVDNNGFSQSLANALQLLMASNVIESMKSASVAELPLVAPICEVIAPLSDTQIESVVTPVVYEETSVVSPNVPVFSNEYPVTEVNSYSSNVQSFGSFPPNVPGSFAELLTLYAASKALNGYGGLDDLLFAILSNKGSSELLPLNPYGGLSTMFYPYPDNIAMPNAFPTNFYEGLPELNNYYPSNTGPFDSIPPNVYGGLPEVVSGYPVNVGTFGPSFPYEYDLVNAIPTNLGPFGSPYQFENFPAGPQFYGLPEVNPSTYSTENYGYELIIPPIVQEAFVPVTQTSYLNGVTEKTDPASSLAPAMAEIQIPSSIPAQLICSLGYEPSSLPMVALKVESVSYDHSGCVL